MKCQDVRQNLASYLAGEVAPSEKKLIQAHLSGCKYCQTQLVSLTAIEERITASLSSLATQAGSSLQSWDHIQAKLAINTQTTYFSQLGKRFRSTLTIPQRFLLMKGHLMQNFIFVTLLVTTFIFSALLAFVPDVRAQINNKIGEITNWFSYQYRDNENFSYVSIGGFEEFIPFRPTYLPEGFYQSGTIVDLGKKPSLVSIALEFSSHYPAEDIEYFAMLVQSKGSLAGGLPQGRPVIIGDQPGVISYDLSKLTNPKLVDNLGYSPLGEVKFLAWLQAEIKVELVSNFPETEIIRIAESLIPMESRTGPAP